MDHQTVYREMRECLDESNDVGTLAYREFVHLDNDWKTTRIERKLAPSNDAIFMEWGGVPDGSREKYQHLFPDGVRHAIRHCAI